MFSSITIPAFPRYNDHRDLKPAGSDPEELVKLCTRILDEHGPAVDQLHSDVRKMLVGGHVAGRRWACKEVREYLTTAGRTQLLAIYYQELEDARQAALDSRLVPFMPGTVQEGLAIIAESAMPYEARVQLRDAIVAVQRMDNEASRSYSEPPKGKGSVAKNRTARHGGASRPFGRVARGQKAVR